MSHHTTPHPGDGDDAAAGSSPQGQPVAGSGKRDKRDKPGNVLSRHKVLTAAVLAIALVAVTAGGWLLYLNNQLGDINDFSGPDATLPEADRPDRPDNESVNILLGGADNGENDGDGVSTAEALDAAQWSPGLLRSDTIMIVHIPADRRQAYLISIPRDSYVTIYDENGEPQGKDKVNAAFSDHGPNGYVSTVEHLTDLRMDHLAIIDWTGFKDISTALGGVEVYIPDSFYDESQDIQWEQGYEQLEGDKALAYVRTRYGLTGGDFDRIARQQNFLREMMEKMLDQGVFTDPLTFSKMLRAVVGNLNVDNGFSTGEIRGLALSLRGMDSEDVTFLTAPLGSYGETSEGSSIVRLDPKQSTALWEAVAEDEISRYLKRYGEEAGELDGDKDIS